MQTLAAMRLALATALVTSVVACATRPPDTATGPGGKADGDGSGDTSIVFAADWSETVTGTLAAGASVRIAYDLDRMTACRGETNGSDAWGISGYAQFDGGAPQSFAVSQLVDGHTIATPAALAIPATAHAVAIWFEQTDVFGCHAYDSNDSANYTFAIAPAHDGATLAFSAGGESLPAVRAGDRVVVDYDPARLATCAGSTGGHVAWGITGHYQVDGGTVHDLAVARTSGGTLVAADPAFVVPRGADLALWFEATNLWGCHAYDSAGGANYHVTIE